MTQCLQSKHLFLLLKVYISHLVGIITLVIPWHFITEQRQSWTVTLQWPKIGTRSAELWIGRTSSCLPSVELSSVRKPLRRTVQRMSPVTPVHPPWEQRASVFPSNSQRNFKPVQSASILNAHLNHSSTRSSEEVTKIFIGCLLQSILYSTIPYWFSK